MVDRSRGFFTETASMRTLTFPSSSQIDWSFRMGLGLVALLAAAEIFGLGYHYIRRGRLSRETTQAAAVVSAPTPARVAPTIAPAVAPSVVPAIAASPATSTLSVADRLLKEATALRERGDTTNALARLQEAA